MRVCAVWLQKSPPAARDSHIQSDGALHGGYTLRWMSCTKLYWDERWGRPPHANIEEPLTSMAMCVCVCVGVCVCVCVCVCVYTC